MGLAAFSEEDKKCVAFVIGYPVPTVQAVVLDAADTACTPYSCDIGTASGHYTDFVTACPKACTTAMYANFDFASGLPDCGEGVGDWDDSTCADDSGCNDRSLRFLRRTRNALPLSLGTQCRRSRLSCWTPPTRRARLIRAPLAPPVVIIQTL